MSNLMSIAISGLNAAKAGLATTGNNLANVGTAGYSRESVQQSESTVENRSDGYGIGTGVSVTGVTRTSNPYLTQAVWTTTSSSQSASTYNDLATTLNQALSGSGSLQTSLDNLYSGFSSLANAPTDTSVRQSVLGDASALAANYNTLAQQLSTQGEAINQQINSSVASINNLTGQIAKLNQAIAGDSGSSTSSSSNALLDQRDALVSQLAGYVGLSTAAQPDGTLSVYSQSGQALVSGAQSFQLGVKADLYQANQSDVTDSSGSDISSQLSGGSLGALLSYRSNVLTSSENMLGLSAIGLASSVNAQQAAGIDQNSQSGAALFALPTPQVMPSSANAGNASVSASISDVSALTSSDYLLRREQDGWSLQTTGGASVSLQTNADGSLSAAGLTFKLSGQAQNGDTFLIKPTAAAAGGLTVSLADPSKLAAAATLTATAASGNTGSASVKALTVTDPSASNLSDPVTVSFGANGSYQLLNAHQQPLGSGTYVAGQSIQANGWQLSLSGTPAAGDSFSIGPNTNGLADNSNALQLANLANSKTLNGGSSSVLDSVTALTGYIGTIGSQAATANTTQSALYTNAVAAQQSVSGVSEDEEAGNLVMYQQAYQASAQVISTAQSIFNSLLSAIRS